MREPTVSIFIPVTPPEVWLDLATEWKALAVTAEPSAKKAAPRRKKTRAKPS